MEDSIFCKRFASTADFSERFLRATIALFELIVAIGTGHDSGVVEMERYFIDSRACWQRLRERGQIPMTKGVNYFA